jgi:hypothetical protein
MAWLPSGRRHPRWGSTSGRSWSPPSNGRLKLLTRRLATFSRSSTPSATSDPFSVLVSANSEEETSVIAEDLGVSGVRCEGLLLQPVGVVVVGTRVGEEVRV